MDGEQDDIQLSPAEIRALMEERDNLMAERDSERRRADSEQNRADSAESQVGDASKRVQQANVQGLSAQEQAQQREIDALTSEIADIKRQRANLQAEGKFEEAEDLAEKMADAAARRQHAMQAKTYLAGQREQAQKAPADAVDRFFEQNPNFSDAQKSWIRQNRRYATDQQFNQRVNSAHHEALSKGLTLDSPEYFKHIADAGYMRTPARTAPAPTRDTRPTASATPPADGDDGQEGDDPYSSAATDQDPDAAPPPSRQQTRPTMAAAAPTRRSPQQGQRQQAAGVRRNLTPEQAEAALAMSEYFPEDVQNGGDAAIYAYYAQLNTSPMAARKREEWSAGV